ncbi:MAG: carbamoyl-phosphate synthase small subunit [Candidatus Thalassarchaeaceae archaeon]|jgi:carbamoyl-phosphate synthase small subunit|tara:strand:+ start:4210 stop:5577 length:1368 start_codon:yes stop_codon:yes gene_type:complete
MINSRSLAAILMSKSETRRGFSPGASGLGVKSPATFIDAADLLLDSNDFEPPSGAKGLLLLADGSRYEGSLFGFENISKGELVFNTAMSGYQESLTDPSFAGQILTFTWPLLGNYGIIPGISESSQVHPRGIICRQAMKKPDHRDSVGSLHDLLLVHGVPGIEGIDTRSLTKKVREFGTLLCAFGPIDKEGEIQQTLNDMPHPDTEDLVASVTCKESIILNPCVKNIEGNLLPRLAVIDCGIKYNILRELCKWFEVVWCPASTSFNKIINDWNPDAIFASNGPGDPAHEGHTTIARNTLSSAVNAEIPVMGICLGHQLMGLAAGLKTYKLRYGHRGVNQPVIDLETGKVLITSQNHGFAVEDPEKGMIGAHPSGIHSETSGNTLGADFKVRHINANDKTVEGLDLIGKPAFTVQFHPEACPGPHDASSLFDRFSKMVNIVHDNKKPNLVLDGSEM